MIAAVLVVVVPFLFWYGTWFGRQLRDSEIEQYLSDANAPRKIQHALSQIGQRIARGDQSVTRWYPKIVALVDNPTPQVRTTAAWLMGQDNKSQEFHDALRRLVADKEPMVRRNAALSLVRFADASGRPELISMLRPYSVNVDREGTVTIALPPGEESVGIGTLLVKLTEPNGQVYEVRSPIPGYVRGVLKREGAKVNPGDEIVVISPEPNQVWEALRALYLVGEKEDLPDIENYKNNVANMSEQIQRQATLTAEAIRKR